MKRVTFLFLFILLGTIGYSQGEHKLVQKFYGGVQIGERTFVVDSLYFEGDSLVFYEGVDIFRMPKTFASFLFKSDSSLYVSITRLQDSLNLVVFLRDSITRYITPKQMGDSLDANSRGFLSSETDPNFNISPAGTIQTTDITNWNNKLGSTEIRQESHDTANVVRSDAQGYAHDTITQYELNDTILLDDVGLLKEIPINAQTGTAYTFVLTDAAEMVSFDNASAITVTVPPNSDVAFPLGTQITIVALGAGQVTVALGTGVTINSAGGALKLSVQYSSATLIKIGTDTWLLIGDITT